MAAGLGFKTFTTGEVLTAADTNGYLMQGILVFASEAARNSAITSPQEGQFAFTKDTNSTWYYDGAAWVASGASGDVTGVTAGTGITVASPTGPVPVVTNDMATTITAAGDIVVGTGSGTYDNLPIGTTAQVLTADTTVSPYKVKWATPASGSTYSGASVYNSAYISIPNNTDTALTFNTENFDTNSYHDTSTNTSRLTVPTTGKYLITANAGFAANATGYRFAKIVKNGATTVSNINTMASPNGTYDTHINNSVVVSATAADYFEIFVFQTSGGALNGGTVSVLPVTITSLGA